MIPDFADELNLPPGGHECTWEEVVNRFGRGAYRQRLCQSLREIVQIAKRCGFLKVIIGGSFPTAKLEPDDLDLTWITEPDVSKETVSPECVKIMESHGHLGYSYLYLAFGPDSDMVRQFANKLGFDQAANCDRGTLILDLECV